MEKESNVSSTFSVSLNTETGNPETGNTGEEDTSKNINDELRYQKALVSKPNDFNQYTKFDSNVFTIDSKHLMSNFKQFGNPFYNIDSFISQMNPDKPFNITRWIPRPGKLLLLGIGSASPLLLAGLYNKGSMPVGASDRVEFFVAGVFHTEFNWMFGMKCNYAITTDLALKQLNGDLDPMSGPNLNKLYSSIKDELRIKKKEEETPTPIERVPVRTIVLVDDMDITALSW